MAKKKFSVFTSEFLNLYANNPYSYKIMIDKRNSLIARGVVLWAMFDKIKKDFYMNDSKKPKATHQINKEN